MNRRNFLRSLGVATAALTFRFRPLEELPRVNPEWADGEYEVQFIYQRSYESFKRAVPEVLRKEAYSCLRDDRPLRFTVKDGVVTFDKS